MAPDQMAKLRETLETRLKELRQRVSSRIRDRVRSPVARGDMPVSAEIDIAMAQQESDTVIRISRALIQMDTDCYGLCGDCEEEIELQRLTALPFAERCKTCEEVEESRKAREAAMQSSSGGIFVRI